ncbi:MAG: SDR family NAD(P)-dependent oxidoreductase [Planctomycetes bacterium]|nr:SDR family NAD(P)-dependent oxidoreductase [Planctomycetota bacterium]
MSGLLPTGGRALVTGASSGIGLAFAHALAERGARVILLARRGERLERAVAEIEAGGGSAEAVVCDLLDPAGLERARELAGEVDLLVNNAGFGMNGRFLDAEPARLDAMFRLDLEVPQILARAAARGMLARGRGGILNVASIAGFVPTPFHAAYSALKAALIVHSEALRLELRPAGIPVTALCPGVTDTEFFSAGRYVEKSAIYRMRRASPEAVVTAALKAWARNDPVVVPGLGNRLLLLLARLVPRRVLVAGAGRTMTTD